MSGRAPIIPLALTALALAFPAAAASGANNNPIVVKMKRGTDTITLTGRLRPGQDCCAYRIVAHAGQILRWRLKGPATRETITGPDGQSDGPGLPPAIPLTMDGAYIFAVHPNLMADGAYGRFTLKLTIPPPPKP